MCHHDHHFEEISSTGGPESRNNSSLKLLDRSAKKDLAYTGKTTYFVATIVIVTNPANYSHLKHNYVV